MDSEPSRLTLRETFDEAAARYDRVRPRIPRCRSTSRGDVGYSAEAYLKLLSTYRTTSRSPPLRGARCSTASAS